MSKHVINLLPEKDKGFTEKILYFALHYLRYIVVITQIVVISVFFFRFTIDQQIVDLKERVNQKQEIIKLTRPIEVEAVEVSEKMEYVKKQLTMQSAFQERLDVIFSIVPKEIILFDFNVVEKNISFKGRSTTIDAIKYLNSTLQKKKIFKAVRIDTVVKGKDGFVFSMVIDL